ncbi:MAG: type IV toxin-antitoxin system AbiEi family antitoxin domain-containing protein [Deltaproteobacteria bacterium]|nr:type IV toxin-antitoxin system AbiEi family antitoxin domain-containing protein [Deltaproteobacteria bacterium]
MKDTEIIQFMKEHRGYARTTDLLKEGISFRDLKKLLEQERIEQVKNGLYRLRDEDRTPLRDFVDVCQAIPKAVVCLYSALSHYELTTFMPTEIMVAIPQGYHANKIAYPPIRAFHFSKKQYEVGIETVKTKEGIYRIYSPEKSVSDAFRFRRKLGDDTAKEALFTYLEKNDKDLKKLLDCAEVCRMGKVMKPYIEARIG